MNKSHRNLKKPAAIKYQNLSEGRLFYSNISGGTFSHGAQRLSCFFFTGANNAKDVLKMALWKYQQCQKHYRIKNFGIKLNSITHQELSPVVGNNAIVNARFASVTLLCCCCGFFPGRAYLRWLPANSFSRHCVNCSFNMIDKSVEYTLSASSSSCHVSLRAESTVTHYWILSYRVVLQYRTSRG